MCADTTAGGIIGEEPIWWTDREALLLRLEDVYSELFLDQQLFDNCSSRDILVTTCTTTTTLKLDLEQFTVGDKPSMFVYLLRHHHSSIVFVLKWAISKMTSMLESEHSLHTKAGGVRKEM